MSKTNLKSQAYATIRKKIVSCEYAPGSSLSEELLTSELNLSRTPIRDALSRLEQEGLLEIKSKRGIFVKPLSVQDINMIFEVRNLYEPYIIRNYGTLLPRERLSEFYNIFNDKKALSKESLDHDYSYRLDSSFHSMIVESCPNVYLRHNYSMIQTQDERFRHLTGNSSNARLQETFREHLEIVQYCLSGNWDMAAEKMSFHLKESQKANFQLVFQSGISSNLAI